MAQTIPAGIYFGFNKAQIQAELPRYIGEVQLMGSPLVGASQNGQSYTFGPRKDLTLQDWQMELQAAMAFFGLAYDVAPPTTAADFRGGSGGGGYQGGGFQ